MKKKIGIIDSGIGGLTFLNLLIVQKYSADYFYISDSENVPYGEKSQDFMLKRTRLMVNQLVKEGVQNIVLACNTLTAETIDSLRQIYPLNFFGIEPYVNYINKENLEDNSKIGLILTPATFKSTRFINLKRKLDPLNKLEVYPLENLALLIEKLKVISLENIKSEIRKELEPVKAQNLKYLVLGCTHYPLIKDFIEKELDLKTIDPHIHVINHLVRHLNLKVGIESIDSFEYDHNLSGKWMTASIENFSFLNPK